MYEKAMRHKMYLFAASIARDFGLGDVLMRSALAKAHCAFDDMGAIDEFAVVLKDFGITLCADVTATQAAALDADPKYLQ